MKSLAELGISPTPWRRESTSIVAGNFECVANACTWNQNAIADAKICTASPKLYAVAAWCKEQADAIGAACIGGAIDPIALAQSMAGIVRRCEDAMAEAGGAE